MKKILFVLGTRPEAIKLTPVILELKKYPEEYEVVICNTEQQKELSSQTLKFFNLKADINLDVMLPNQTLAGVQSRILTKLSEVFESNKFDATIVQGDTMTAFCGALASFYNKTPIFHIEAGLRSYDMYEPFPEEAVRQMTTRITDLHFAPTMVAKEALIKENIEESKIYLTGNTVIDALRCLSDSTLKLAKKSLLNKKINFNDKLVLVTVHRRENHGERLDIILEALLELADKYKDHQLILPVHPNPNVKSKVHRVLQNIENILLLPPLDYPELVTIMEKAKLVLTDSGGIQEEAPSFGCPVLVMRYETERKEGIDAGFAKLVGADKSLIMSEVSAVLGQDKSKTRLDGSKNPYGDGEASKRIKECIQNSLYKKF